MEVVSVVEVVEVVVEGMLFFMAESSALREEIVPWRDAMAACAAESSVRTLTPLTRMALSVVALRFRFPSSSGPTHGSAVREGVMKSTRVARGRIRWRGGGICWGLGVCGCRMDFIDSSCVTIDHPSQSPLLSTTSPYLSLLNQCEWSVCALCAPLDVDGELLLPLLLLLLLDAGTSRGYGAYGFCAGGGGGGG